MSAIQRLEAAGDAERVDHPGGSLSLAKGMPSRPTPRALWVPHPGGIPRLTLRQLGAPSTVLRPSRLRQGSGRHIILVTDPSTPSEWRETPGPLHCVVRGGWREALEMRLETRPLTSRSSQINRVLLKLSSHWKCITSEECRKTLRRRSKRGENVYIVLLKYYTQNY